MVYTNTRYFNLTAVREQTPSVNDWAATYWNWVSVDTILYGLLDHHHTGAPALSDPTGELTLTYEETGGTLLAGRTYYFVATYIDSQGLETSISPEAYIEMPDVIAPPEAPTIDAIAIHTPSGLQGGSYWYKLSYLKGGAETTPGASVYAEVPSDTTYEVILDFGSLTTVANGADTIRIYRKIGSTGSFVKLADITNVSTDSYTDDNSDTTNCSILPKSTNNTNSLNTIEIDCSTLTNFDNAIAINIYCGLVSGVYSAIKSLVKDSAATYTIDLTDATPGMSYIWTGVALQTGRPPAVSQTYPAPDQIDLAQETFGNISYERLPEGFSWGEPITEDNFSDWDAGLIPGEIGEVRFFADYAEGQYGLYFWNDTLATPTWQPLLVQQGGIEDANDATPSLEEAYDKINAILAALRSAGILNTWD